MDVDVGQLAGRHLKDCPVVVNLHELFPVGRGDTGGRDRRRFERFPEVCQDLPDRPRPLRGKTCRPQGRSLPPGPRDHEAPIQRRRRRPTGMASAELACISVAAAAIVPMSAKAAERGLTATDSAGSASAAAA